MAKCIAVFDDDWKLFKALNELGLPSQEVVADMLTTRLDEYLKENDISKDAVKKILDRGIRKENF